MKDSYKTILVEGSILLLLILQIFTKIIPTYGIIILLLGINLISKKVLNTKKETTSSTKELLLEFTTFLLTFFILYYLFGLLIGFTKTGNYYSINGIVNSILPIILYAILREKLRYNLLVDKESKKDLCRILLIFILLDFANRTYFVTAGKLYTESTYLLLSLIPAITSNLVYTYISKKESWIPISFFSIVIGIYPFLMPIIPNANIFLQIAIQTILPVLLWVRLTSFYEREEEEDYNIKNLLILLLPTIFVSVVVYFYSGLFRYYAIAIATESMSPEINRGDIVLIDQKIENYNNLKVGQIIAYKKDNYVIIHRIVDKRIEKGTFYFQTKGDKMEENEDEISEEKIIGTVSFRIKYIGYPTIWFNNV